MTNAAVPPALWLIRRYLRDPWEEELMQDSNTNTNTRATLSATSARHTFTSGVVSSHGPKRPLSPEIELEDLEQGGGKTAVGPGLNVNREKGSGADGGGGGQRSSVSGSTASLTLRRVTVGSSTSVAVGVGSVDNNGSGTGPNTPRRRMGHGESRDRSWDGGGGSGGGGGVLFGSSSSSSVFGSYNVEKGKGVLGGPQNTQQGSRSSGVMSKTGGPRPRLPTVHSSSLTDVSLRNVVPELMQGNSDSSSGDINKLGTGATSSNRSSVNSNSANNRGIAGSSSRPRRSSMSDAIMTPSRLASTQALERGEGAQAQAQGGQGQGQQQHGGAASSVNDSLVESTVIVTEAAGPPRS